MHEYGIVDALLKQIDQLAGERGATAVRTVHLRIGQLAGVEPDLLVFAFEGFREDTICAGAELRVQSVEPRWACRRCGDLQSERQALRCNGCGDPLILAEGDEIILERLEMEVADVS